MNAGQQPENITINVSLKAIVLAVIVFLGGLGSGYLLFFSLNRNSGSTYSTESVDLTGQHVWFMNTWAEAAIVVTDTGVSDVTLRRISVNGVVCDWIDVYYLKGEMGSISGNLQSTSTELTGSSYEITIDGTGRTLQQASSALYLASHEAMVLYVRNAGDTTATNTPSAATITVYTDNNAYAKECSVDASIGFMGTEQVIFTSSAWGSPGTTTVPSFLFKVKNTGSADLSIAEIRVDDVAVTTHNVTLPYLLTKGTDLAINITQTFTRGASYRFSVVTLKGNTFGPYTATGP